VIETAAVPDVRNLVRSRRRPVTSVALPASAHVLVVQTSFLGDVVLATPLLSALRRRLSPRRLSVMVRPEAQALVRHHPCVDAVIVDDKRGRDRGVAGLLRVARRVRAEDVDIAVAPHRSLRTALILAAARVPRRVGFAVGPGAALYHVRVPRDLARHDVERNLSLMEAFGRPDGERDMPLVVPGAGAEQRADALLASVGLDGRARPFGLCPGSVWPTKRWNPGGFGGVARALHDRFGGRVLVLGGSDDLAAAAAVTAAAGDCVVNLAGRTDLETFVAIVRRLRVLVSNDSAPMHVATAVNVPVVAVFCATSPVQGFGPYGERATVVAADLACRPCSRHGGRRCPRGTEDCMRLVMPADVLRAVESLAGAVSREQQGTGSLEL
jgi:heptosyltransferase-2